MWELLQKIEDLGWKPYGKSIAELTETEKNVRLLTSLSSGLWQFVCENKLFRKNRGHKRENDLGCGVKFYEDEPEYYIIECALLEEGEIEDFLLQNIKVGND